MYCLFPGLSLEPGEMTESFFFSSKFKGQVSCEIELGGEVIG